MKRLELSVAADADLFDILAYGAAVYGEAVSDAYYCGLAEAFDFLCEHPEAGQSMKAAGLVSGVGATGSIAFSIRRKATSS